MWLRAWQKGFCSQALAASPSPQKPFCQALAGWDTTASGLASRPPALSPPPPKKRNLLRPLTHLAPTPSSSSSCRPLKPHPKRRGAPRPSEQRPSTSCRLGGGRRAPPLPPGRLELGAFSEGRCLPSTRLCAHSQRRPCGAGTSRAVHAAPLPAPATHAAPLPRLIVHGVHVHVMSVAG
jgi:hypothetical protein